MKIKKHNQIQNQKGSSLIVILIAVGILSILSLLINQNLDSYFNSYFFQKNRSYAHLISSTVQTIFSDRRVCNAFFNGQTNANSNVIAFNDQINTFTDPNLKSWVQSSLNSIKNSLSKYEIDSIKIDNKTGSSPAVFKLIINVINKDPLHNLNLKSMRTTIGDNGDSSNKTGDPAEKMNLVIDTAPNGTGLCYIQSNFVKDFQATVNPAQSPLPMAANSSTVQLFANALQSNCMAFGGFYDSGTGLCSVEQYPWSVDQPFSPDHKGLGLNVPRTSYIPEQLTSLAKAFCTMEIDLLRKGISTKGLTPAPSTAHDFTNTILCQAPPLPAGCSMPTGATGPSRNWTRTSQASYAPNTKTRSRTGGSGSAKDLTGIITGEYSSNQTYNKRFYRLLKIIVKDDSPTAASSSAPPKPAPPDTMLVKYQMAGLANTVFKTALKESLGENYKTFLGPLGNLSNELTGSSAITEFANNIIGNPFEFVLNAGNVLAAPTMGNLGNLVAPAASHYAPEILSSFGSSPIVTSIYNSASSFLAPVGGLGNVGIVAATSLLTPEGYKTIPGQLSLALIQNGMNEVVGSAMGITENVTMNMGETVTTFVTSTGETIGTSATEVASSMSSAIGASVSDAVSSAVSEIVGDVVGEIIGELVAELVTNFVGIVFAIASMLISCDGLQYYEDLLCKNGAFEIDAFHYRFYVKNNWTLGLTCKWGSWSSMPTMSEKAIMDKYSSLAPPDTKYFIKTLNNINNVANTNITVTAITTPNVSTNPDNIDMQYYQQYQTANNNYIALKSNPPVPTDTGTPSDPAAAAADAAALSAYNIQLNHLKCINDASIDAWNKEAIANENYQQYYTPADALDPSTPSQLSNPEPSIDDPAHDTWLTNKNQALSDYNTKYPSFKPLPATACP